MSWFVAGARAYACVCVWERERERDEEMKDSDCYIWYHIFLTYVVILYSKPQLVLLFLSLGRGWSSGSYRYKFTS